MLYFRGLFALNFSHIEIEQSVPDSRRSIAYLGVATARNQDWPSEERSLRFSCVLIGGAVAGSSGVTWSQALCLPCSLLWLPQ